jgi:hypothetical protein
MKEELSTAKDGQEFLYDTYKEVLVYILFIYFTILSVCKFQMSIGSSTHAQEETTKRVIKQYGKII